MYDMCKLLIYDIIIATIHTLTYIHTIYNIYTNLYLTYSLGKTTLETYLLQHHIWLTSNAKTLLTIVPNHPWINFAITTVLFFTVSKELYRLTMSLRYISV